MRTYSDAETGRTTKVVGDRLVSECNGSKVTGSIPSPLSKDERAAISRLMDVMKNEAKRNAIRSRYFRIQNSFNGMGDRFVYQLPNELCVGECRMFVIGESRFFCVRDKESEYVLYRLGSLEHRIFENMIELKRAAMFDVAGEVVYGKAHITTLGWRQEKLGGILGKIRGKMQNECRDTHIEWERVMDFRRVSSTPLPTDQFDIYAYNYVRDDGRGNCLARVAWRGVGKGTALVIRENNKRSEVIWRREWDYLTLPTERIIEAAIRRQMRRKEKK